MYGGSLCETGSTADVLTRAFHPYTRMLLASVPGISKKSRAAQADIPLNPPMLDHSRTGCVFQARCPYNSRRRLNGRRRLRQATLRSCASVPPRTAFCWSAGRPSSLTSSTGVSQRMENG